VPDSTIRPAPTGRIDRPNLQECCKQTPPSKKPQGRKPLRLLTLRIEDDGIRTRNHRIDSPRQYPAPWAKNAVALSGTRV